MEVALTQTLTSAARLADDLPEDFLERCAAQMRSYDLPIDQTPGWLSAEFPQGRVEVEREMSGFTVRIAAETELRLYQARESVHYLLDQVLPGRVAGGLDWTGAVARDTAPPNFHLATVVSVTRVGASFLRVELACRGAAALSSGGMHFSLLLPPRARAPRWPRIDGSGRTVWAQGEDALHRAAYTFVEVDPEVGRFTFDVFEHEGGRTTAWARSAAAGETVGIMGPGGGDFPSGDELLIAGDETALPAIRRILETSPPERRGAALIEVADDGDRCPIAAPVGLAVTWLNRNRGEHLWDHLRDAALPEPGGNAFVWVAAEQSIVRRSRSHFRGKANIERSRSYFSSYWMREDPSS